MKNLMNLNEGWSFLKDSKNPGNFKEEVVNIPHNWNSKDGQDGGNDYFRGFSEYTKTLDLPTISEDELLFIEFQGVNASCEVFLDDVSLVKHDGGYSTFRVELPTKNAHPKLKVVVENTINENVYPQKADFTFYGGIYRDVNLLVINKNHFDITKFGGLGARILTTLNENVGKIEVDTFIIGEGEVKVSLFDADKKLVKEVSGNVLEIENPHLWNGLEDPYLYNLKIELLNKGICCDVIEKRIGFRSYKVDPKKGFFLNGKSYPLRGVCRHQDRKDIGNSLTKEMQDADMKDILEIGANTIRLAHYQHNDYFLDLCDENGLVIWAEIPYISKHIANGNDNLVSQMNELLYQQMHHASIFFWGISNEITMFRGHQKELLAANKVLNNLCHEVDPTRSTTMACFSMCSMDNRVTKITDVVSWNLYFGWYTPFLWLNPLWYGFYHLTHGKRCVGLSEYGAEGMTNLHSNHPHRGDSTEEYQLQYHNYMCKFISKRPYMWATHIWNMFDFGSDGRNQGGDPGVNHKGLITFDHQTKKDSFYICKAYWSKQPFVHIAGKRFQNRDGSSTKIVILTNEKELTVKVNGEVKKVYNDSKYCELKVKLDKHLVVEAIGANSSDTFTFKKVDKFDENYKLHTKSNNYSWEK